MGGRARHAKPLSTFIKMIVYDSFLQRLYFDNIPISILRSE